MDVHGFLFQSAAHGFWNPESHLLFDLEQIGFFSLCYDAFDFDSAMVEKRVPTKIVDCAGLGKAPNETLIN